MDGLGRFIQADNHSAVDVGDLRRGTKSLLVKKKPQCSEALEKELDELTLRADEVVTQKALINTEHIEFERWGPPRVDVDWRAFCEKPNGGQKAKALLAMKVAWIRSEDILDRTQTRPELWEEHLKDPIEALAKVLECLENLFQCWFLVCSLLLSVFAMTCSIAGTNILQKM